jgi:predicted dehydrogenase
MLNIGIIGTGNMAHAHARNFAGMKGVRLTACCDVSETCAKAFAEKWKIPKFYTDYNEMLEKEKLDGVSNVTPDAFHAKISIAVMNKGTAILCEKPLATTLEDAKRMAEVARQKKVINMVNFSYRNSSGLQAAAVQIAKGAIGELRHVESSYLQSWLVACNWGVWSEGSSWLWRLSKKHSMGVLGDIGCHIYDMTTLLCGDIQEIFCKLRTFHKAENDRIGDYVLDANDSFVSEVVFKNGAMGTVHSSRWATGQINSLRTRVFGTKGGIEVDLDRAGDAYRICRGKKAIDKAEWKEVKCKKTPNQYERFIKSIKTGKNDPSNFENGVKIQAYLHYSMESGGKGTPTAVII